MAAARIGIPSPIGVVATDKPTARFFCNACTLDSIARVVNSTYQLKRVRFLIGNKVDSIAGNPKSSRRSVPRNVFQSATPVASACGGSDEESGAEENGCVHLGRRAILGALVTSVALSRFEKPGVALTEAKGEKGNKSKGGEKGKENAGPGEKWKMSRVYDATVLGEPVAVGGERSRVWQKLLQARVVYLGEAERVPDADDRVNPYLKPYFLCILNFYVHLQVASLVSVFSVIIGFQSRL